VRDQAAHSSEADDAQVTSTSRLCAKSPANVPRQDRISTSRLCSLLKHAPSTGFEMQDTCPGQAAASRGAIDAQLTRLCKSCAAAVEAAMGAYLLHFLAPGRLAENMACVVQITPMLMLGAEHARGLRKGDKLAAEERRRKLAKRGGLAAATSEPNQLAYIYVRNPCVGVL
jgi:hypothetical protein